MAAPSAFARRGAQLVAEMAVLPERLDRRGAAAGAPPHSLVPLPPHNVRPPAPPPPGRGGFPGPARAPAPPPAPRGLSRRPVPARIPERTFEVRAADGRGAPASWQDETVDQVFKEIEDAFASLQRINEMVDVTQDETGNVKSTLVVLHYTILRNKRCLMAY